MHGDEFGAVGEGRFDLYLGDHFRNAVHHVLAREQRGAVAHELGDGAAVAGAFQDGGGDEGDGFGVVELEAAGSSSLCQESGGEDEELVLFARAQFHLRAPVAAREAVPSLGRRRAPQIFFLLF